MDTVDFLLVPDRAAARRARRELATERARLGVLVGTWSQLIDLAHIAYVVPDEPTDWRERLGREMLAMREAFWADSLDASQSETISVIEAALEDLLESLPPGHAITVPAAAAIDGDGQSRDRAARHVADLVALSERLGGALPPRLASVRGVLDADADRAIRAIEVHRREDRPPLTTRQQALVDRLNRDAREAGSKSDDVKLEAVLARALDQAPAAPAGTALGRVQRHLFDADGARGPLDGSLQVIAARDYLEELEVAAGIVQQATTHEPGLEPADFGLLLPDDQTYHRATSEVFAGAGIPISGLTLEPQERDVGREAVLLFLETRRKWASSMALASLYALPIMPWSEQQGLSMAQHVIDRDHTVDAPEGLIEAGTEMVRLIQEDHATQTDLATALELFAERLSPNAGLERAVEVARDLVERITADLDGDDVLDDDEWRRLERLAMPEVLHGDDTTRTCREGVAVFAEHQEPWRQVRRLIAVGFSADHFPSPPGASPVLTDADKQWLWQTAGAKLRTGDELLAQRRLLLRRQLSAVSEHLTVLLPRRDPFGLPVPESSTLTFLAALVGNGAGGDLSVIDLSTTDGLEEAVGVAVAGAEPAVPPRATLPESGELHLNRDLLQVRHLSRGYRRRQSPTSLEELMSSPLAWLLGQAGIGPRSWEPDDANPLTKGSIAHAVFEDLFPPGAPPAAGELEARVDSSLSDAIRRSAPFLDARSWRVERHHLRSEIASAAKRWLEILIQLDARVVAVERKLFGEYGGASLTGKVDAVIALPGDVVYVADFKKSSSKKRAERMSKGFDHQVSLYRLMLESDRGVAADGQIGDGDAWTPAAEARDQTTGVLYYMMNDRKVLADEDAGGLGGVSGAQVLGRDVSQGAMTLIRERLDQVRSGTVQLNRSGDESRLDKLGLPAYALERSALVPLLTVPDEEVAS